MKATVVDLRYKMNDVLKALAMNEKAAKIKEKSENSFLSIQTYMELLQGAKNKSQHKYI